MMLARWDAADMTVLRNTGAEPVVHVDGDLWTMTTVDRIRPSWDLRVSTDLMLYPDEQSVDEVCAQWCADVGVSDTWLQSGTPAGTVYVMLLGQLSQFEEDAEAEIKVRLSVGVLLLVLDSSGAPGCRSTRARLV